MTTREHREVALEEAGYKKPEDMIKKDGAEKIPDVSNATTVNMASGQPHCWRT